MAMDLRGINNYNEYYTNHYFSSIFEENAADTISAWRAAAKDEEEARTPWSLLRDCGRLFSQVHDRHQRVRSDAQVWPMIKDLADSYLETLGFPAPSPFIATIGDDGQVPVYLEMKKTNGAPLLWVLLVGTADREGDMLSGYVFDGAAVSEETPKIPRRTDCENEELVTKVLFNLTEPPRWLVLIGIDGIALIDRGKWNEKRYLYFDCEEIFGRREESTLQAMAVLLHRESLCPDDGNPLLDKLDDNSHRHASGVSQDLKYALREAIELLGNEVLYDLEHRQGCNLNEESVDASQLTIECLRYMYRMLFMLFIEARPELGYAPMKTQTYVEGYSLEYLRDIADDVREDVDEVSDGYYLHETLAKLYELIYNGYPTMEDELKEATGLESLHDVFVIEPLKAHIFDPEYTKMITTAKLRNIVMLKIIDLMSISRGTGRRGSRGRISYSTLGINQMGAVYEALLSYRGFIAEETLFEVKRKQDNFDELDVGYFVPERELENYDDDERVRYSDGKLRTYEKGTFIYRLAGREREKSASYYTPEVLTKCLVKYALKELLEGKTADEILSLTICEPAMGSAAFLNEAVNQLAEAYIDLKQKETGDLISYEDRQQELQKVKMYIADRNVYGIDLNPTAVELAEVSLWLNTIFKGGFVPWFKTQIVNGNSLIGARRQVYRIEQLETNHSPDRWWENAPTRIEPNDSRMPKKQVYHFLMGDPGMANYTDKVIKSLAPNKIKAIKDWNKGFIKPYNKGDIETILRISGIIDTLWDKQVELQKEVERQTADALSVYGQPADTESSHTTIREKDLIFEKLYKTEGGDNASPYARLKFAMDYWCALWFWPIDKADMLPSRSEFLFDMDLILEGGIVSVNVLEGGQHGKNYNPAQMSLFPTEMQDMAGEIYDTYAELGKVNLDEICAKNPRLALAKEIADEQHFLHWELEFADLFAERGGFDLIIGNPPWIKYTWKLQDMVGDTNPLIFVKEYSSSDVAEILPALNQTRPEIEDLLLDEYVKHNGAQTYFSACQNYELLQGIQTNLYKCFITQAWAALNKTGISAFLHPTGVFDDNSGGELRGAIYSRLICHFRFENQRKLFADVEHNVGYSINVYHSKPASVLFGYISDLYEPRTIDECFEENPTCRLEGLKTDSGEWNTNGHPDRIIKFSTRELSVLLRLFSENATNPLFARLPSIHSKQEMNVLTQFDNGHKRIGDFGQNEFFCTELWHESERQKDGTIAAVTRFPDSPYELVMKGAQINLANPFFACPNRICRSKDDYEQVFLPLMSEDWLPRSVFTLATDMEAIHSRVPTLPNGNQYTKNYRLAVRRRISLQSERTLIPVILPPGCLHVNTIFGMCFSNHEDLLLTASLLTSLPFDYFVRTLGKGDFRGDTANIIPVVGKAYFTSLAIRVLLLNCLSTHYCELWSASWNPIFAEEQWTKHDSRLDRKAFSNLGSTWDKTNALDYEYVRRQALLEIDVLAAMALGMELSDLVALYKGQFPVLVNYEKETLYDANGNILFRSRYPFSISRNELTAIQSSNQTKASVTYSDDTQPGGAVERTIEYVAPFDRCDREQDYETAWAFFEKMYGGKED